MHGKLIYNDRALEIVVYNLHVEMYLFTDIITHIDTLQYMHKSMYFNKLIFGQSFFIR